MDLATGPKAFPDDWRCGGKKLGESRHAKARGHVDRVAPTTPMIVRHGEFLLVRNRRPTGSCPGNALRAISSSMIATCSARSWSCAEKARPRNNGMDSVEKYSGVTMLPPQRGALSGGGWSCPSMASRTQEVFGAPRSGMALVMAADCAPGSAATFSRTRSYKEFNWFACEATSAG